MSRTTENPVDPSNTSEIARQRLIVFSDDWGRHPSSCQHLVRQLLPRHDVVWINTIGMRPPRLDWITVRRGLEKFGHWRPWRRSAAAPEKTQGDAGARIEAAQAAVAGPQPRVVNPVMWPSFRSRFGRRINRTLLSRAVRAACDPKGPTTVLTTIPVVTDLVEQVPGVRWIYYCVDDFGSWPGLDGSTMEAMERDLVTRVDAIVAAGDNLAERVRSFGRESTIITHGVDLDFWRVAATDDGPAAALRDCERPLYMFWGLIDRRLDLKFLTRLTEQLQRGTVVLIGPEQDPDPALATLPRVRRTGPMPFTALPQFAAVADALVMPYDDLPVTRAMQPLKLKEYLATGKPVIVRRLPATAEWDDCLDAVDDAETFTQRVLARAEAGLPDEQRAARRRLEAEGWAAKARRLEQLLFPREGTG